MVLIMEVLAKSQVTNKQIDHSNMPLTIPSIKLNDGTSIPIIGFGTGSSLPLPSLRDPPPLLARADVIGTANYGQDCTQHVLSALETGYRYLDGAEQYRNSGSVRDALKAWGGKREEVYILTKCTFPSSQI
jgi:diketogulonate reductase-like aldo/keto reductase